MEILIILLKKVMIMNMFRNISVINNTLFAFIYVNIKFICMYVRRELKL